VFLQRLCHLCFAVCLWPLLRHRHADDVIVLVQVQARRHMRPTMERTLLGRTDCLAFMRRQKDKLVGRRQPHRHHSSSLSYQWRYPAHIRWRRSLTAFFTVPLRCGKENNNVLFFQVAGLQQRCVPSAGCQLHQVAMCLPLPAAPTSALIHFQPVPRPLVRKDQIKCVEAMRDYSTKIFFARLQPVRPLPPRRCWDRMDARPLQRSAM